MERDPAVERRREAERVMVHEGQAMWRRQLEERRLQQLRDQRELQEMLARYSPWGRPGGGAPNLEVRKRKLHLQELFPDGDKGRPAIVAAPPPPPRQRSGHSGGGGGGSAGLRSDTQLHFQANEPGRRAVDVLRYRQAPPQQQAYRRELDALVDDRRRRRQEEIRSCTERERLRQSLRTPWGRPGPGGILWRHPGSIGLGFLYSLGWTDESTLRSISTGRYDVREGPDGEAGVELVPLLARRRTPAADRHPLSSTDVTRQGAASPVVRVDWKAAAARSYTADLTQQVATKQQYLQRLRQEDVEGCRRHFATWQSLWGRPGHGAPCDDMLRHNLDHLLRQLPVT
ncbi:hypothetical protein R5R35_013636 [Gryllus longicercus]|uniref:Uncharacterized protein n=1 Tax=Gryllus longicercus TaxID=2509291 RepID=A0AAN9ZA93_9ORTH